MTERELIRRLSNQVAAFVAPGGSHLALRSQYSSLGVCTMTLHKGHCHQLCRDWISLIAEATDYLERTAAAEPAPAQLRLEAQAS